MNYDIQLKSELFDLNKDIRLCQFRYTFESILNPLKVSTEAWEYNKHKNIFARIIDWFKRFITITIPTFFKKNYQSQS